MVDSRFFSNSGAVELSAIASLTGAALSAPPGGKSEPERAFSNVAPLDQAGPSDISFLDNIKYLDIFAASKAGACFIRAKFADRAPEGMQLLVTEDPYYAFARTAHHFYPDPALEPAISPKSDIAPDAVIGAKVRIDSGAVIGRRARIGDGSWIGANTVIGDGVEIGEQSRIGALCTISHAILGKRVTLHRGIHIGQDGFGFAPSPPNTPGGIFKVPQLGRVLIGDDVEIGSGTCIDRGAGPDTIIGSGSKIDNLVQIGHNVHIGKFVIIAAGCGIAGSTQVGDGVMLGGQVGLAGHIKIGPRAKIAAQSGVMHDVPAGAAYGGSPAIAIKDWHRQTVAVASLVKKKVD